LIWQCVWSHVTPTICSTESCSVLHIGVHISKNNWHPYSMLLWFELAERFHDYKNPRVLKFVDSVGMRYSMTYWSYLAMLLPYRWCILLRMSKNSRNPRNVHLLLHWWYSEHTLYIIDFRPSTAVEAVVVVIILTNTCI